MIENPLVQFPTPEQGNAIHILVTKPGVHSGSIEQQQEVLKALPIPPEGKHWEYQPMALYPLRFATIHDADMFMEFLKKNQATDRFFVPPMTYEKQQQKWRVNKAYNEAHAELAVFVARDNVAAATPAEVPAQPEATD